MLSRLGRRLKLALYLMVTFVNSSEAPLLGPSDYKFSDISRADCISALVLQELTLQRTPHWRKSPLAGETAALGCLGLTIFN